MITPCRAGAAVLATLVLSLSLLNPAPGNIAEAQGPDQQLQKTARGIQLYQQGDYQGAIAVLQEVAKQQTEIAEAWYYLGLAYNREGWFGAARPAFEHLLTLRPDSADANAKLSYALILSNEPQKAIAAAKRAIELGDQSPEPHYAIAESSFRTGAAAKAIEEADLALQIKPDFAPALITKSLAHNSLEQYSEAATSLERFLSICSNDADAEIWRGQLEELRTYWVPNSGPTAALAGKTVFTGKEVTQRVRVLKKPEPSFTEEARRAGVSGTVVLQTVFAADGEVKHIFIIKALGYGLTAKAVKAARLIKFEPAMMDGKAVSMYMNLEYSFNLY